MSDSALNTFTRKQHGLVTKSQTLTVLSEGQLKRRLRDGRFESVRRGVYRVGGAPESWEQHLLAACLAAGTNAVASFRSAAALFELPGFTADEFEITVLGGRPAEIDGVTVHESEVFGHIHLAHRARIPVTSPARTLCDLSAIVPEWQVARAVDDALRRKLTTIRALTRVAEHLEGRGRLRCTVTREILERRRSGFHPGDSDPEVRIAKLLIDAGLPAPVQQHRVQVGGRHRRLDLAYPELKIAIEYDGWEFHSQRSAFDGDRARANELELLGWTVLRFTSASSDRVIVKTVAAALARASRS